MNKQIKIEYVAVDELTPAEYNPRVDLQAGDERLKVLMDSIKEFGFVDPIIVNDNTGLIVGGHQRLKAAALIGMEQVPVVRVKLSEAQEKVLNVGLNKIGGEFDDIKLGELLQDIEGLDIDIALTGLNEIEIDGLITALNFEEADLSDIAVDPEEEDGEEMETFEAICTNDEYKLIMKCIKRAKSRFGVTTKNEALAQICNLFWEETSKRKKKAR